MASVRQVLSVVLSVSLPLFASSAQAEPKKPVVPVQKGAHWALPLSFERNEGQMPAEIGFLGRTQRYSVAIGRNDLRFSLPGARGTTPVVISLEGSEAAAPRGITQAPFLTNTYLGSDVSKYRTGIRNYSRIGLSHVYPGVDAEFYGSGDEIEHDFIVAAGANADAIAMRLSSHNTAKLTSEGEVLVPAGDGELRLKKPVAYQITANGQHQEVVAGFVLGAAQDGGQSLRFRLGDYDHTRTLVIDPVIVYATVAAGVNGSTATSIATDPSDNVYVSGITTSPVFNASPAIAPVANCGTSPCANNIFIASLAKGSNGTALQWITYIGATDASSITTPTSLIAGAAALYVGGSTNDSALAAGLTATAPNPTSGAGGSVGYISALTAATGVLNSTTLVYADAANPNNSSVQALALDAGGNVYAAGAIGTQVIDPSQLVLNPTANALTLSPAVTTFAINQQGAPGNAYVLQLPAAGPFGDPVTHVATPAFFTYVQGNTQINGVAVDAAGLIYMAGQSQGDFGAPLVAAPVTNLAPGTYDAFAATFAITPLSAGTASTVTAFTPIAGTGDDQVAGIAIDGAGNSYLFGPTNSADLPTTAGVIQPTPPNATLSGYVALIPAAGTTPTALTYLGSSGGDSILSGAFGGGNLYVAGQTAAPTTTGAGAIAFGGVPSTVASGAAPFNMQALVLGMDTTTAGLQHGYLASVNGALTAVNYVANIGGALTGDVATGVALDSAFNAYVSGATIAGSAPYTSYSAYQTLTPATSGRSGYVAEIAYAATSAGLTLVQPATGSPSVDPIGYGSAANASNVSYTWTLNATSATAPTNLVLQIAGQTALTYNSVTIADVTDTTVPTITCPVSTGGVSCVIPAIAQQIAGTNDTLSIVLAATVTAAAPTTGTLTVTASISGPAADYVSLTQTSNLASAAQLSISPATTFPANTVFSTNTAATGPNTQAVYAFTVANAAGAGEAKTAQFTLATPPTGFLIGTVTAAVAGGAVATTCDTTVGATGCQVLDLPAGASLTYTLTGTYPDAVVDATGSTVAAGAFTASVSGSNSTMNATITPNTTVERGVHLKLTGTLSSLPTGQTAFNLADTLTYSVTIANNGPSATSGTDSLVVTLPSAFVATGVTGITCAAPYTTCTIPVIAAGSSITYVISGSFPDTNANSAIAATAQSETFSAAATLKNSFDSGGSASDYSTTVNTTVQRTAVLTVTTSSILAPATTCGGGSANCLYMQNPTDTKDKAAYTFVVQNAGPNTAVNANVTLTFPFAPANPAGTVHPLNPGTPTTSLAAPAFGTPLTCTVQAAANQIVCTGGNLPVNATALKVTGNATIDAGTVPSAAQFVTTTTSRGSVAVTEDANGAPANTTLAPVEVDRAAHLVTVKTVAAGPGATAAFPLYLSNTSNTNDIVTVTIKVGNSGPNDATNVVVAEQLPAYFVLTQAPTGCSVGGTVVTTAYPPQPAPVTMTCTLGTVAAGDATPSFGGTAASAGTTASTITYAGKFQDNGLNPDITGIQPNKKAQLTVTLGAAVATTTAAIDALGTSDATSSAPSFVVERAVHLVTTVTATPASGGTAAFPIFLNNAAGTNNLVTVAVRVGSSGPNDAPSVVVTASLPPYFVFTQAPTGCTVGGVAVTTAYPPQTSAVTMTCALNTVLAGDATPSTPGPLSAGTIYQSITYTGGFQDNGASPDITGLTASKKASLSVPFGTAAAATVLAVDPLSFSDATSKPLTVDVQRAAHLILRKTRNGTVATAPSSFFDTSDPNLDEKTTATTFGVNDEVEYAVALGNAGVNQALGAQFTETLPPFFTVMKVYAIAGAAVTPDTGANAVPAGQLSAGSLTCYAGGAVGTTPITLPFATSGSGQQITCSYGTATSPIALPVGTSKTGIPDNATSIEFVYQGKFQDNAPGVDTIPAGTSTFAVGSAPGEAVGSLSLAKDNGPLSDSASLAIPAYQIQRAAHLAIVGAPQQLNLSDAPLTVIGQAEPSSVAGSPPVINCLRYKVLVQNSGPNIARQPQLTVSLPTGLNLTDSPIAVSTTPATDAPLAGVCSTSASTAPTILGTATVPVSQKAGNTLVFDIDGYFGLETLTNNSTTGFQPTFASLVDKGVLDSVKTSAFTPVTGSSVTLVNTPVGSNFYVSPFQPGSTVRPARIGFATVTAPGATTLTVGKTGPALPTGPSPDPRANKQVIPLYRTGATANFYALASNAAVTAGVQSTQICLTSGATGALPDLFAKPERVLLWALSGLPSGTGLNAVPNVTSPYLGDITSTVRPVGANSYVAPGGPAIPYTTYAALPGTQNQPLQVCGQVNGFAPSAAPLTVAVLEPVNFAPYITANSQQTTAPPGKGVSEVSFLFPTSIHDYNDTDPCYVSASTTGTPGRAICDDNLLLTTWIFGGESLLPSLSHVVGPFSPAAASAFVNAPAPYAVQAGATLFFQVADQLAIPVYKATGNCDPGNAPGSYQPNTANACPLDTTRLTGTPPQETIFGSADIALLAPSAGGGSSGLIILPPAANATLLTTPVATGYIAAAAAVTAGQTVGFQWKLGDVIPAAGGTYNLACFLVDKATQNTQITMPAGLSCQIPSSITYPPNATVATAPANPAIYVVTSGSLTAAATPTSPGWRGALGGVLAALLLPVLLFRRRSAYRLRLGLVVMLLLGGAVGLSGCGSGQGTGTVPVVAPNQYFFRATATPAAGGATLVTAPFSVTVAAGN